MAEYRICPRCGANLDPGERCDCADRKEDDDALQAEGLPDEDVPKADAAADA